MPLADYGATPTDDAARRAVQRRLAQLQADNTVESLNAGSTLAAAATPQPSFGGQPSVLDQSQRAGERSPFQATGSQLEEMQRSIADAAARNAAPYVGGGSPNTGTSGGLAGPSRVQNDQTGLGGAISRRLSGAAPDLKNNPLGIGATPASLGAGPASASVQRATGTAPLDRATQERLGSAPLSSAGQAALGVAPNSPETQAALGVAPVNQPQRLPTSRPTALPIAIDQAQRVGERSSVPAYDMDALRAEAARRAADANAGNVANTGTTTTTSVGSVVRPPQPPTQPPTTDTFPPPDDTSISDAFTKMFQGQGDKFFDATAGTGAAAGAGGTGTGPGGGLIDQSGGGADSRGLQQQLSSDLNEISGILSRGANAPDVQSIFATQGKTILDMLDQQIRELQSEGENVDPATQNVLAQMREELVRQLKANLEGLNARGIAESGIAVEAEAIMRKGNMSDQAKLLAERLSRIQQSIQGVRGQKTSTASQFGLAGANAQTQAELAERNRMDDLRGLRQQGRTTLLNNQTQIEEAQRSRDFDAEQNNLQRRSAMAQKMADLAANANDRAAERQWKSQQADLDRQLKASLDAQVSARSGARGSTGARGSAGSSGATGDITDQAIDDMFNTFATRREAEAALRDPAILRDLQENGVDIGKVIAAAQGLGERRIGSSDY